MAIQHGMNQQTPAVQNILRRLQRSRTGTGSSRRKKRRSTAKSTGSKKRKRRSNGAKAKRFVKGSAAAKRHMSKLRKMRKK